MEEKKTKKKKLTLSVSSKKTINVSQYPKNKQKNISCYRKKSPKK